MRDRAEYLALKSFLVAAKVMPVGWIYGLWDKLARLLYRLDAKRRRITVANIAAAFPKLDTDQTEALALESYRHMAQTAAEIVLMAVDRFDIDEAVVNKAEVIKRLEWLRLRAKDRGVIAMTAHFGNWELLAHFLARHGFEMLVIGREGNNKLIEQRITTPFRRRYGNDTAYKDNAMLAMVKRLKKGGNVGILIDQKAGGPPMGAKIPFFDQPADTTLSIAQLKEKLDPLVVPIFIARLTKGQYRIEIGDPVEYDGDAQGKERPVAMTQEYNRIMERTIRRYPEQWFWMHNRWRR